MEKLGSTLSIGFRELFRIIVPGLLCVIFIEMEFGEWGFVKLLNYSFVNLLVVAFFIGLILYVFQPYRYLWLFNRAFKNKISNLGDEVKKALGVSKTLFSTDPDHNAEYKYFLETEINRSFVDRVHYFTSFYYLLIQISLLFFIFAVVAAILAFIRSDLYIWYILAILLYLIGTWLLYRGAEYQLQLTINEQIVMIRLNSTKFSSIQKILDSQQLKTALLDRCNSLLHEVILDPRKQAYNIECKEQESIDWRTGVKSISYVFKIMTPHPLSLGGEPGGYKGFYKERIESVLNQMASLHNNNDVIYKVFLEIVPTDSRSDSLESLISLDDAIDTIVTKNSPVLKTAKKHGMEYILVRGRHLIGPNPGLVEIVEELCKEQNFQSVLDLFAGTGTVSLVFSKYMVPNITCVDNGKHFSIVKAFLNNFRGINCVEENVFNFPISIHYDIIIADPYYEDSLNYLSLKIGDIFKNTNVFVFVCCGTQNEYLRDQCKAILARYFTQHTDEKNLYGQSIFICKK